MEEHFFSISYNKDLVSSILIYLSWEDIMLLGSSSKSIFINLRKIVSDSKFLLKKKWQDIPLFNRKFIFVDDEITVERIWIAKEIENIAKKLVDFNLSYIIQRNTIYLIKVVFNHPSGDQIYCMKYNFKESIDKTKSFYKNVNIELLFDTILEYRNNKNQVILQIGTSGEYPFLYIKDQKNELTWGQSHSTSKFPFIKTKENLIHVLPFYKYGFHYLDPNNHTKFM